MTGSRILSLGHYQPSRVLTNDDLAQMVDTNDEWIRDRVGIETRRIAAGEETVADMAAAAAAKALAGSGLTAADIDLVVVATCSSVDRCPNVATRVASKLGITAPGAYDLNTACSGFSYALATVDHAIAAGASRNAIVVGAEKLSDVVDWTDRSTAIIFGDGAGAAVVTAAAEGEPTGIGPVIWGSAPDKGDAVRIEGWRPYIQQEGQAVFRWATTALAPIALQAIERAGVAPSDIAAFVAASGQLPHHRRHREAATAAQRRRRQGHRRIGQHVRGECSAGPVEARRAAGGAFRGARTALRLRWWAHLRRAGCSLPVATASTRRR